MVSEREAPLPRARRVCASERGDKAVRELSLVHPPPSLGLPLAAAAAAAAASDAAPVCGTLMMRRRRARSSGLGIHFRFAPRSRRSHAFELRNDAEMRAARQRHGRGTTSLSFIPRRASKTAFFFSPVPFSVISQMIRPSLRLSTNFVLLFPREGGMLPHSQKKRGTLLCLSLRGRKGREDVGDGVEGQVWRPRGERRREGGRVLRQPLGHSRRKKASRSRARPLARALAPRFFSS